VTLFLTPVFYIYMEEVKVWGARLFGRKGPGEADANPSSHGPLSTGPIGAPIARSADAPDLSGMSPTDHR